MKKEFYISNRKDYCQKIKNDSVTVLFSGYMIRRSADEDYDFEVDKNFYYLTGINQANVKLVIYKKDETIKEMLFIEKNDPVLVKWVGAKLEKEEASTISGIDSIYYLEDYNDQLVEYMGKVQTIYTSFEHSANHTINQCLVFSNHLKKNYPDHLFYDNYEIIVSLRSIKKEEEIDKIKESISVTKLGIEELMRQSKPGLFEYQLESYFDFVLKNNGQRITSFKTIAAGGINAATLHYVNNNSVINDNELILFDLGCETEFYISDISRTFPVNGKFTPRQKEVYEEVLNCNKACINFLHEGVTRKEYNDFAKSELTKSCYKLGLIKSDEELVNYYFHSIGHSIGLDTHDPCVYEPSLKAGMTVTVEPGLYIPEEKIGIRIEDDVLITKDGCVNLSKDIIKEVVDIENFFKNRNK